MCGRKAASRHGRSRLHGETIIAGARMPRPMGFWPGTLTGLPVACLGFAIERHGRMTTILADRRHWRRHVIVKAAGLVVELRMKTVAREHLGMIDERTGSGRPRHVRLVEARPWDARESGSGHDLR